MLKECREIEYRRPEITDEQVQKRLWHFTEKQIEVLEKEGAVKRGIAKRKKEEAEKAEKPKADEAKTMETNGNLQPEDSKKAERKPGSRRSRKEG